VHDVQMGNAQMGQQRVIHFRPTPQTRLMQNAKQAMELAKRQVVELAKITQLEEKKLQVQEERVG